MDRVVDHHQPDIVILKMCQLIGITATDGMDVVSKEVGNITK